MTAKTKTRAKVAKFLKDQLEGNIETERPKSYYHWGYQEARDLLDFIYGREPKNKKEELIHPEINEPEHYRKNCKIIKLGEQIDNHFRIKT